jgi:hypothetical protein
MNWPAFPTLRLRPATRRRGAPCRRFGVLDGMILVAGSAVGIFLGPKALPESHGDMCWVYDLVVFSGFVVMLSSVLMLIFRLRQPRPPMRRVANQPGFAACFAMVTIQMALIAGEAIDESCFRWFNAGSARRDWSDVLNFVLGNNFVLSWAVIIPWSLLVIGRRWRAERGWIDGIGQLIGYAWIAWGLLGLTEGLLDQYVFDHIHKG